MRLRAAVANRMALLQLMQQQQLQQQQLQQQVGEAANQQLLETNNVSPQSSRSDDEEEDKAVQTQQDGKVSGAYVSMQNWISVFLNSSIVQVAKK